MENFKVGDHVYVEEDFISGKIVEIQEGSALVEFRTSRGGGCLPFKLSELKHEKIEKEDYDIDEHPVWKILNKEKYVEEFLPKAEKCMILLNQLLIFVEIPL